MKRRTLIAGVGSLVGGAGVSVGAGAFSYVSVERNLTVSIVDDPDAYLAIDSVSGGGRAVKDDGRIRFTFPGVFEKMDGLSNADGLGTDSVYEFADDATGYGGDGLFEVKNQGTKAVNVHFEDNSEEGQPNIDVFDVTDEGRVALDAENQRRIGVGEEIKAGMRIDTHGTSPDRHRLVLSIVAEEVSDP